MRAFGLLLTASLVTQPAVSLTLRDLENFTYNLGDSSSVEGGRLPLAGGKWSDATGGSSFTLLPTHAIGDLDGDGSGDAIAIIVEDTGGIGSFSYMFAVMNRGGKPVQEAEPEWLGDRTIVERLSIDRKGIVSIRFVTHKDGDDACCPTLKIEDRYRVVGGRLVGITK